MCLGRLTAAEHYGYWAHAWWSDDDARAVASGDVDGARPADAVPGRVRRRTVLRETEKTKPSGGENVRGSARARRGARRRGFRLGRRRYRTDAGGVFPSASVARVGRGKAPSSSYGGSARTSRAPSAGAETRKETRVRGFVDERGGGFSGAARRLSRNSRARSNGGKRSRPAGARAASRRRGPVRFFVTRRHRRARGARRRRGPRRRRAARAARRRPGDAPRRRARPRV